ncbi:MAG: ATP-binding protein [Candidatus Gastranaerophilales bacterium]|nr:ATP-binding protein [Candidatus Gastranaerophilales bacterium]
MGMFLNSIAPYEGYKDIAQTRFFVDKSAMISELISTAMADGQRYLCITRPRRFGKSVMANMVGAFFGRFSDEKEIFSHLEIAKYDHCLKYLHLYDVIYIDFSRMPQDCNSFKEYISRIQLGINRDLAEAYPELKLTPDKAVWDNLHAVFEQTKTRFVFVMDEWDAIFHKSFISETDKKNYLEFLRNLLKGQAYVELAYMTGVLPIEKYSSGSEMNMFQEYDMATKKKFSEYFGFLASEVDRLFTVYQQTTANAKIAREDLTKWYDGYHTAAGVRIYNPRSIVCALTDNQISNYWTSSGPYDEIFYYVRNNINDVRDDLVMMVSGERIEIKLQGYAATSTALNTKNQIFSAMVVYGLLTYEDGAVLIPNRELMDQFDELLLSNENLGYVYNLAKESERMLKATLAGDTEVMAEILKLAHDTESPIFSYNSEIELSAVVNLVYLAARDKYRVEREDKAGEGYVDFIFYPERKSADALILELKVNATPTEAIEQIKEKNYILRFRGKMGETPKYTGRILAVGISYDKKTKKHSCKVEEL